MAMTDRFRLFLLFDLRHAGRTHDNRIITSLEDFFESCNLNFITENWIYFGFADEGFAASDFILTS